MINISNIINKRLYNHFQYAHIYYSKIINMIPSFNHIYRQFTEIYEIK